MHAAHVVAVGPPVDSRPGPVLCHTVGRDHSHVGMRAQRLSVLAQEKRLAGYVDGDWEQSQDDLAGMPTGRAKLRQHSSE